MSAFGSSLFEVLSSVNHDPFAGAAFLPSMIIDTFMDRGAWIARVGRQIEEIRQIAKAADDETMRDELLADALRLEEHARRMAASC
jgi:hypothetical protein